MANNDPSPCESCAVPKRGSEQRAGKKTGLGQEVSRSVGRHEDTYAACPYYKRDDKQMICCEGLEPGTVIRLAFASALRRREYKNQFCRGCWGQCALAQMQNQRYGYK